MVNMLSSSQFILFRNTCSLVLSFKTGLFAETSEFSTKRFIALMQGGRESAGGEGGTTSITDMFDNLVRYVSTLAFRLLIFVMFD